jgi:hypothetical protein
MAPAVTTLSYEIGVTRLFGSCDLGDAGLVEGWSAAEEAHVWNDGPQAIMHVTMARPRRACVITFQGEPFITEGCKRQELTLFVNGFYLSSWRLTEARSYHLSARIELEQFWERGGKTVAQCVWYMPRCVRPSEIGLGSDYRELGFCFRTFAISEDA